MKIKYFILIVVTILSSTKTQSQNNSKLDDFGRIVLNTYLPELADIPSEAIKLLETKLTQIASNNGMGGNETNPRFIITASINIGTKDIIAGPPQMVAQNIDLTIFIGDGIENKIYSNITLSLKGVGTNENKSLIDAIKKINPKSKEITELINEAKSKIIAYYNTQCDFTIKEAMTLKDRGEYDKAIYSLSLVPEVCEECYYKCLDTLLYVYQEKIDADGEVKLNKAKAIWASNPSQEGAEEASDILSKINSFASCQPQVDELINSINAKLKADEKARWEFKMKQYADNVAKEKEQMRTAEEKSIRDDEYREKQSQRDAVTSEKQSQRNYELDKLRVGAYRDVAIEYAKNQPKTITYNNIYWK